MIIPPIQNNQLSIKLIGISKKYTEYGVDPKYELTNDDIQLFNESCTDISYQVDPTIMKSSRHIGLRTDMYRVCISMFLSVSLLNVITKLSHYNCDYAIIFNSSVSTGCYAIELADTSVSSYEVTNSPIENQLRLKLILSSYVIK